jgi:glutamate racemase
MAADSLPASMVALSFPPVSPAAPIGVFDSGIGGLSVLRALRAELPDERFVYLADSGYAPYGERDLGHVVERSRSVTRQMREAHGIKALVVACNTATTAAIQLLREEHPDLPLVGVEPAIKPAIAVTRTGRVGVIGTRGTLTSAKFAALLASLQSQADFVVQPCDGLALAIETEVLAPPSASFPGAGPASVHTREATDSEAGTAALCRRYTHAMGRFGTAPGEIDTLVLGCTHYVFAEEALRAALGPDIAFIETGEPVARQTRRLLDRHGLLAPADGLGGAAPVELVSTGDPQLLEAAAARWLGLTSTDSALLPQV